MKSKKGRMTDKELAIDLLVNRLEREYRHGNICVWIGSCALKELEPYGFDEDKFVNIIYELKEEGFISFQSRWMPPLITTEVVLNEKALNYFDEQQTSKRGPFYKTILRMCGKAVLAIAGIVAAALAGAAAERLVPLLFETLAESLQ